MSLRKRVFFQILLILLLILAFVMNAPPVARADTTCRSVTVFTINNSISLTNSVGAKCFELKLQDGKTNVTIELRPNGGKFDLYRSPGPIINSLTLTSKQHKLNYFSIGPGNSSSTFVLKNVAEGSLIIAVAQLKKGAGKAVLTIGAPGSSSPSPTASEEYGRSVFFVVSGGPIAIGAAPGDHLALPIKVFCPGLIEAEFSWQGSANELDMRIIGPGPGASFVEYARQTGGSPLRVSHQASTAETRRRDNWWILITNTNGGDASGDVWINYPDPNLSNCPQGWMVDGKITMLRINEINDGYGPPEDWMDVEVVVRLDSTPDEAFGFQLRNNDNKADHEGMLGVLRAAYKKNRTIRLEFDRYGTIFRVAIIQ